MKRVAAAVVITAISSHANAAFVSGNDLLEFCDQFRASSTGYVLGAVDTILVSQDNGNVRKTVCLRGGATGGQLTDIVCQYLRKNPAVRDFGGPALVSMALSQAFPCQ
ncbi:Rap1a/Tai family immunity protein [Aliirhizobium cellulosilyticum]|uniref:Rap1a/Tai family immunity protein n=1 Tax=Aliirhizobium cellulosilyticum TaxID=393664 RepID=UPI00160B212E